MIWVAEEREYKDALREGRRAVGMPWPAGQMVVVSPSAEVPEVPESTAKPRTKGDTVPDAAAAPKAAPRNRLWWRRFFGS